MRPIVFLKAGLISWIERERGRKRCISNKNTPANRIVVENILIDFGRRKKESNSPRGKKGEKSGLHPYLS